MNGIDDKKSSVDVQHPFVYLKKLSTIWNLDIFSEEFSKKLDDSNLWPCHREKFFYPKMKDLPHVDLSLVDDPESECIYFCGNSLGLMPRRTKDLVNREFDKWAKIGVFGHTKGELPWQSCEEPLRPSMARLAGGLLEEVALMNFLTVNLHFLMVSFYQPTKTKYKILLEEKAFPSDHYVVESQIRLHDLDPKECMMCLKPRQGEYTLRTEDIIETLEKEGDSIALVFFSGVQYFTGQLFNIKEITKAAHDKGCMVGWDLAHAIGNVELKLHDWDVDFAAWCTYKYLNSGAGSIGVIFVHEKHFKSLPKYKKLEGWWGHRLETRFEMSNVMDPCRGASSFAVSNCSMLLTSCLKASLDIYDEAGIGNLRTRSKHLTAYMEALLNYITDKNNNSSSVFHYITPTNPEERGAQISIRFKNKNNVKKMSEQLEKRGVVFDFREPDVLRFAPAPLYNTFNEVFRFINLLNKLSNEYS